MSFEVVLVGLAVGLAAGWLASAFAAGRTGAMGDIVVAMAGAVLAGYVFRLLGIHLPFRGIAGTLGVAFVGAVFLLLVLRAVRGARI
jgi:uncharacterized membrane protein YeaQ/YmgE (transglycosylase-associated protein family)